MAIQYTLNGEGDTLMVKAAGFDESLEQVQEYGMAILSACMEGGYTRVLCNEVELEYRLGTFDTYADAAFMSAHVPRVARVAIVCNPKFIDDARFFEDVAVNRGLTVRVFQDPAIASQWLRDVAPAKK